MEMKLKYGDYVPDGSGGFETCTGFEEKLERVLYKLMSRRGGFAPMPELGSDLYKLLGEKRENRSAAARKYILEALESESELTLCGVEVTDTESGLLVKAEFCHDGKSANLAVSLS